MIQLSKRGLHLWWEMTRRLFINRLITNSESTVEWLNWNQIWEDNCPSSCAHWSGHPQLLSGLELRQRLIRFDCAKFCVMFYNMYLPKDVVSEVKTQHKGKPIFLVVDHFLLSDYRTVTHFHQWMTHFSCGVCINVWNDCLFRSPALGTFCT